MTETGTPELADVSPSLLADLMLGAALEGGITLAVLEPGAALATVSFERAGTTVARRALLPEVAMAVGARLAILAHLDPEARAGTAEGAANVARIRVRAENAYGELLVSVVGTRLPSARSNSVL